MTLHCVSLGCSSSDCAKRTDVLRKLQWLDNTRSKLQEYVVDAQPCDTSSLALRPRTVQEYTLNMTVMGSVEPQQAVVHHGMANEVVVAGALNSEMCDKNVQLSCSYCTRTYGQHS